MILHHNKKKKNGQPRLPRFETWLKAGIIVALVLAIAGLIRDLQAPVALPPHTTMMLPTPIPMVIDTSDVCTEAGFDWALKHLAVIVLDCDMPLVLTSSKSITQQVTIAGLGTDVTISGDGRVLEMFVVNPQASLTLRNVSVIASARYGIVMEAGSRVNIYNSRLVGHGTVLNEGEPIHNQGGILYTENTQLDS